MSKLELATNLGFFFTIIAAQVMKLKTCGVLDITSIAVNIR